MLAEFQIPYHTISASRKVSVVICLLQKAMKQYFSNRSGILTKCTPIDPFSAKKLLDHSYKQISKFGYWCPVKVVFIHVHAKNMNYEYVFNLKICSTYMYNVSLYTYYLHVFLYILCTCIYVFLSFYCSFFISLAKRGPTLHSSSSFYKIYISCYLSSEGVLHVLCLPSLGVHC